MKIIYFKVTNHIQVLDSHAWLMPVLEHINLYFIQPSAVLLFMCMVVNMVWLSRSGEWARDSCVVNWVFGPIDKALELNS